MAAVLYDVYAVSDIVHGGKSGGVMVGHGICTSGWLMFGILAARQMARIVGVSFASRPKC